MNSGPILVVPAFEQGQGGGHLIRSQVLVRDLRTQGREAYLHIPGLGTRIISEVYLDTPLLGEAGVDGKQWSFIVLDRFRTKREEFVRWSRIAPVIGIDEGGACREEFDFLIDLLPGLLSPPNLLAPWMLPLPKKRRGAFLCGGPQAPHAPRKCLKMLVSFGAEDPAGLTLPVSLALIGIGELTVVLSMLHQKDNREVKETLMSRGVRVIEGVPELREYLADYDLVITHFGLTAFESLYAKVPVLLVSPSAYHEKLAKNAGFVSVGIGRQGASRLPRLMGATDFLPALGKKCEKIAAQYKAAQSLGTFLATYSPLVSPSCPCCGAANHRALVRFPDRTYRRCTECGMVYMLRSSPPPIEYAKDYFFDFYKKQYGKTYLEDFPGLIQTGKTRVQHIKALLSSSAKPRLLDIGCAYGPFLVAAQEEGFSPTGLEAAEDAVRYVQDELAIPCFRGLFPDTPLPAGAEGFDVISLWYVIEHFKEPHQVLNAIGKLLKPGGVLAFSTPSLAGISGRVSRIRFLDKSPADHWTIWEPRQVRSILARFGFRLKKIIVTGHHPERFPLIGTFLAGKQGPLYRFFLHLSHLFRLGDTFEVYAVKSPRQGLH